MNWIQVFIQIAVSILLLEFAGANPIGSVSVRSAHSHLTNASSSSSLVCDSTHPYCCNPPLNALSLSKLYDELNIVIDLVAPACTDKAFIKNVSVYIMNVTTTA